MKIQALSALSDPMVLQIEDQRGSNSQGKLRHGYLEVYNYTTVA